MMAQSFTTRLLRGTLLVTLITALAGAATAALIARGLWMANERGSLRELAAGLDQAAQREAAESAGSPDAAAAETMRESVTAGRRAEVWRDSTLIAASPPERPAETPVTPLGPPGGSSAGVRQDWLIETRPLSGGLMLLVASPRARGEEALRIFGWSLLFSTPVCLALAIGIGRLVGRRVTRPILQFKDRIVALRPLGEMPVAAPSEVLEIAELESSFREVWERLRQSMKRELEFAANAAHELRTPLTRIRLHAEHALAAPGAPPSEDLRDLIVETGRLARLVDSLLVLSRDTVIGIPDGEVVNISDLAIAASRRVFAGAHLPEVGAPLLESGAPVPDVTAPPADVDVPDEALVRGDEALLEIAVENLLDNARKFSLPGRPPRLQVGEVTDWVRLTVVTPGARIPADLVERLFERFYRGPEARASHRGHGLGLPLARHIARLHGGDVRCVSGPDEDARFELALPAWRALTGQ